VLLRVKVDGKMEQNLRTSSWEFFFSNSLLGLVEYSGRKPDLVKDS
jgi:hypothetical protein